MLLTAVSLLFEAQGLVVADSSALDWLLAAALAGLAFSLYLAHVEAHILGVWCVYCAISLGDISLITLLALATTLVTLRKPLIRS